MRIDLAVKMALDLMKKHNLLSWALVLDTDKNYAGYVRHKEKEIGLSRLFLQLNNKFEVKDTILHEIAHALLPEDELHGSNWKVLAKKIGAKPYAQYRDTNKLKTKVYKKNENKN